MAIIMKKFQLSFITEQCDNIQKSLESGEIYYTFWGILDILVEGQSFFKDFRSEYQSMMGSSSISEKGLTVPVYSFINQISETTQKLKQTKRIIVSDDQIDKLLIFNFDGDFVYFAIKYGDDIWYDGTKLTHGRQFPGFNINRVKYEDYKKGCFESIRTFLETLIEKEKNVTESPEFMNLLNKVKE